ncbi:hypothetical protein IE53DRAFT_402031 [Violaceomyces palustris]|uniref:Uncharacterized protein n=1 Tax=Violaceomyces palustris TaxID=1673888 RepID=A0ACD0P442_9BASI|nr:hypothetical protein IE53DRAFT_402031 [Violaceomyces palustris]
MPPHFLFDQLGHHVSPHIQSLGHSILSTPPEVPSPQGPIFSEEQRPSDRIQKEGQPSSNVVLEPSTSQPLPLYLEATATNLPPGTGRLKLVGLGVRTVSFLRVRVYVAAFYCDENHLERLSVAGGPDASLEKKVKELADSGVTCALRIVPVRSTDFAHLRDGFVRALQARLKLAIKSGSLANESEASFSKGIQDLKSSFPKGSVPKGEALDLVMTPALSAGQSHTRPLELTFEFRGKVFGRVESGQDSFTVARELLLAYFSERGEISTPLKKSVEENIFKK